MKSILFIIPSLSTGGTCSSLISLTSHLRKSHKIRILSLSRNEKYKGELVNFLINTPFVLNCLEADYAQLNLIGKLFAIFQKIAKRIMPNATRYFVYKNIAKNLFPKFDIIVGYEEGPATLLASCDGGIRKLAWIHCDYVRHSGCGKEGSIYEKFDTIVCVSKYTANQFKKVYPGLCKPVISVYNIINIERIVQSSLESITKQDTVENVFSLLSVGRIHPVKRFNQIPRIAAELKKTGISFVWHIIGPAIDKTTVLELTEAIERYDVNDCVFFIGNKENPYPYFKRADLLVCTSSSEACPVIFQEAKVLKLPVISSDFPSATEFLTNNFNGFITPIEHMPQAISTIIGKPDILHQIKTNLTVDNNESLKILNVLFD